MGKPSLSRQQYLINPKLYRSKNLPHNMKYTQIHCQYILKSSLTSNGPLPQLLQLDNLLGNVMKTMLCQSPAKALPGPGRMINHTWRTWLAPALLLHTHACRLAGNYRNSNTSSGIMFRHTQD